MKFSRLLRDASILVTFCGCFYLLTLAVSWFDSSEKRNTEFSAARVKADYHWEREEWVESAAQFKKLTQQDRFNGRAWYMLAFCHYNEGRKLSKSARDAEAKTTLSQTEIASLKQSSNQKLVEAKRLFEKSEEFARFRKNALVYGCAVSCRLGEYDVAIEQAREFVQRDGTTRYGLDRYEEFGVGGEKMTSPIAVAGEFTRLHQFPEFWAIVRQERFVKESR